MGSLTSVALEDFEENSIKTEGQGAYGILSSEPSRGTSFRQEDEQATGELDKVNLYGYVCVMKNCYLCCVTSNL